MQKKISCSKKYERVFLPRINLEPSEISFPFIMRRRQFPVISAFAMTMKKSEGQYFCNVGVEFPEPVFGHGMIFVQLTGGTVMKILRFMLEGRLCQMIEHLRKIF